MSDALSQEAELLATMLQVDRSRLTAMARQKFMSEHREHAITERVNGFIAKHGQPIDPIYLTASSRDM
jgi:hypothetical protein